MASWSYGAAKTVTVAPTQASDGWYYQGNATFGYTVTVYENNTSATTFELSVERTMGASFSLQFCYPTCSGPVDWVNLTYRAWESTSAIDNFTTQGTVTEGGQSVPAVALLNSTISLSANTTEFAVVHAPTLGLLGTHTRYVAGNIAGVATLNFTPALGLFPINLQPGSSWSATSAFAVAGQASYRYYFAAQGPIRRTVIGPLSGPLSFASTGSVTVQGTYPTGSTVQFGGVTYPAISLTVIGPFSVREGVIFVPEVTNLFGSTNPAWAANASAATSATQATIDAKASANGHFGLAASSWRYSTNSLNPADSTNASSEVGGVQPAVTSSGNPVSTITVQGEPQTSDEAGATQQCLTSGSSCPLPSPSGTSPSHAFFAAIVVIGVVVIVGALVAVGVVTRRRSMPPPSYPNATLYPPGTNAPYGAARSPAPAERPPPEDDPLNHLW